MSTLRFVGTLLSALTIIVGLILFAVGAFHGDLYWLCVGGFLVIFGAVADRE